MGMKVSRKIYALFLAAFVTAGCAPLAKLVVGKNGLEIPQIVAHLAPAMKDNMITVAGRIVMQNPTKSSLDLDKIYLEIKGENNVILAKETLDWEKPSVISEQELEAPVKINLGLSVLNNRSISVFIRTGFTYKTFGLHIPVESRVAVLHLEPLKETIARPLYVNIFTQLKTSVLGNSSVRFVLEVANPLSIDLILEEGAIRIYTLEGKDIVTTDLNRTLFKGSKTSEVSGSIKIGNIWGKLIRSESVKRRPLKFQASGKLRIPDTDIFIPFKIESVIQVSFSLT